MKWGEKIFNINSSSEFSETAMEIFRYQAAHNPVYKKFLALIKVNINAINEIEKIPFLPIELFKNHKIISGKQSYEKVFKSSGTGGLRSQHFVKELTVYHRSLAKCFKQNFGKPEDFCFLGLVPNYLEKGDSSLVYMLNELMKISGCKYNGFYLNDFTKLANTLEMLDNSPQKKILFGVSYALLDFGKYYAKKLNNTLVIETGGMKGRQKEILRKDLHKKLKSYFGLAQVYSEYGMTELLSQAYCHDGKRFRFPKWVKVFIRDIYDPYSYLKVNQRGGINIIDLANVYACSFIETQDIGRLHLDDSFEILGRIDHSDLRGCSLLID